ncbi:hypothetical protein ACLESO_26325 [Pyxidicoccus sp. 3LG]
MSSALPGTYVYSDMVPTLSASATRRMDTAVSPSASATSIATRTMRSTLSSGLPLRLDGSWVFVRHSSARLRAGSPRPLYSVIGSAS